MSRLPLGVQASRLEFGRDLHNSLEDEVEFEFET